MPKNLKQWIIVFVLSVVVGNVLFSVLDQFRDPFPELTKGLQDAEWASRETDRALEEIKKSEQESEVKTSNIDPKTAIIGKWQYWGDSTDGGPVMGLDSSIEYFDDGTYFQRVELLEVKTESGNYEMIEGNKLKRTWEECNEACEQHNVDVEISFPDKNTMYLAYSVENTTIYKRIETEPEKEREGADVLPDERLNN